MDRFGSSEPMVTAMKDMWNLRVRFPGGRVGDRRGQALAMAAVSMVAVIAMGAIAVDLSMALAARAAAQRAADSAALAGASAFLDFDSELPEATETANARAIEYATANDVLANPIDPSQVTVWVTPEEQTVRVRIVATGLPAWFARVLNVFSLDVAAAATAVATDGGSSNHCVLPFTIVDLWDENDPDEDPNNNDVPDAGEEWFLQDEEEGHLPDPYYPYADDVTAQSFNSPYNTTNGTGLGSSFRDNADEAYPVVADFGRRIVLKTSPQGDPDVAPGGSPGGGWHPNGSNAAAPGNFHIWQMPDPDAENSCAPGTGGGQTNQTIAENISGCNPCAISLGEDYPVIPGNKMVIEKPMQELYALDDGAYWSEDENRIKGSKFGVDGDGGMFGEGTESPLIRIVTIASPLQDFTGSSQPIQFNNLARIFIEPKLNGPDGSIYIRFLGRVSGGSGPATGHLVKYLRLVE